MPESGQRRLFSCILPAMLLPPDQIETLKVFNTSNENFLRRQLLLSCVR